MAVDGGAEERHGEAPQGARVLPQAPGESRVGLVGRDQRHDPALGGFDHLLAGQVALALGRAHPPMAQQRGEAAIAGAVRGPDEILGAVRQAEAATGHEAEPDLLVLRGRQAAHEAGQGIAVGDAEGGMAQGLGGEGQLVRVGGALQEGEVREGTQLGIGFGHAK